MKRGVVGLALGLLLLLLGVAVAADLPIHMAQGTVEKVDKDSVTIQPRVDGKFGKNVVLRLTETSKVTTLSARETGGKQIVVQKSTDPKDLRPKQAIAVTYTTTKEGNILLSAVAQPGEK